MNGTGASDCPQASNPAWRDSALVAFGVDTHKDRSQHADQTVTRLAGTDATWDMRLETT